MQGDGVGGGDEVRDTFHVCLYGGQGFGDGMEDTMYCVSVVSHVPPPMSITPMVGSGDSVQWCAEGSGEFCKALWTQAV